LFAAQVLVAPFCFQADMMDQYWGKHISCPYSLTEVQYATGPDGAAKKWVFPQPLPRTANSVSPPLPPPRDALREAGKGSVEACACLIAGFVQEYASACVGAFEQPEHLRKRLLTLICEELSPKWTQQTLKKSWSTCGAPTDFSFPDGSCRTYEVKLCKEFARTGKCDSYRTQGCCWYAHIANLDAVRAAGNLWNCRWRDGSDCWHIERPFWIGKRGRIADDDQDRLRNVEDGVCELASAVATSSFAAAAADKSSSNMCSAVAEMAASQVSPEPAPPLSAPLSQPAPPSIPSSELPSPGTIVVARHSWTAWGSDAGIYIDLCQGDFINVEMPPEQPCGWLFGFNANARQRGWFPPSFCEQCRGGAVLTDLREESF
jgi:hypothetical protein